MRTKRRRIVILTRRYAGEASATTSRLSAYVRALQSESAQVVVVTRFPFVYPGHRQEARYARRLYLKERIDGATVVRLRLPGSRLFAPLLEGAFRLRQRLRGSADASIMSVEVIDLCYGLAALPIVAALRPQAIIAEQGPVWLALPMSILARLGVPLVLQVSDVKSLAMERGRYGPSVEAQIRLNRRLEDALYDRATSIVTVTEAQRSYITGRLKTAPRKVHLVPNGAELCVLDCIDTDDRQSCKQRIGLDGKFVVLYAGTFGSAHDLQTLLETARRLRHVSDIAFLLMGQGPTEQELRRTAASWGLDNVVFRRGVPLTSLTAYLGAADVGVSTEIGGLRDTVRAKIYLYMAGRLPVIATDDEGEVRALVNRAGSGHLVRPGDAAAIAERLLDLKLRPEVACALGESGRRFVERHHDRAELARRFARVVLRATRVAADAERETSGARLCEPSPEAD